MMVRSIFGLFASSPFSAITDMAESVRVCSDQVPRLFSAFYEGDYEEVRTLSETISHLEHEVDVVKTRVRDNLPRTVFLPVDRRDVLELLSALDAVADCAEDVGILFTLRQMEPHAELMGPLRVLVDRVMDVVHGACDLLERLDVAAESGFQGPEAHRVLEEIDRLGELEHRADVAQDELSRTLFSIEDRLTPGSLFLWSKIFNKVGDMANHAEVTGNRLRLFFAT